MTLVTDCYGMWRVSQKGQHPSFTNASRVFELSVRNREANQTHPGQELPVDPRLCVSALRSLLTRATVDQSEEIPRCRRSDVFPGRRRGSQNAASNPS